MDDLAGSDDRAMIFGGMARPACGPHSQVDFDRGGMSLRGSLPTLRDRAALFHGSLSKKPTVVNAQVPARDKKWRAQHKLHDPTTKLFKALFASAS